MMNNEVASLMNNVLAISAKIPPFTHLYTVLLQKQSIALAVLFIFDKDLERLSDLLSADLNANNPDLSKFFARGGKIISYSGSADPCVPFPDTMNYYERVLNLLGGYDKVAQNFRYFLVPGRDHGRGGLGANTLLFNEKGADLSRGGVNEPDFDGLIFPSATLKYS